MLHIAHIRKPRESKTRDSLRNAENNGSSQPVLIRYPARPNAQLSSASMPQRRNWRTAFGHHKDSGDLQRSLAPFEKQSLTGLSYHNRMVNSPLLPTCGTISHRRARDWKDIYPEDLIAQHREKIIDSIQMAAEKACYDAE
jgi:hypothetical protein